MSDVERLDKNSFLVRSERIPDSILSSSCGGLSICSLLFDVNGLGTRCSLFSMFSFRFFQIVPQSRRAFKKSRNLPSRAERLGNKL